MKEGRTFSKEILMDMESILIKEATIEHMGIKDFIGKTINHSGADKEIIRIAYRLPYRYNVMPVRHLQKVISQTPYRQNTARHRNSNTDKRSLWRIL